ncbi:MAG: Gfo/Idh/MocA family oxidoreductase [Firmicutes bacterium]|nr:Gfo/Idh/MocA family oxidoreductase [Bacillota bacterium]
MMRIAMLSGWHVHAPGYAREILARSDARITAVWDEDPERGRKWAADLGVPFEECLDAVLGRADVDGVVINAPTNRHPEVIVAAAKAGKHIFTEKVMAITVKECLEIKKAVEEAGVKFCISFPHRTWPVNLLAKQVMDEGLLGDVTLMRVRNAHNGASAGWLPEHFWDPVTCGGGAMIDLGAHPMYLIRWIMGEPKRISAMFTHYTNREVEDNAVALIEFGNKSIAISETGFVSQSSPFTLELHGTEGTYLVGGPERSVRLHSTKLRESTGDGWVIPTRLPAALPMPMDQWIRGVLEDAPIYFGLDEGIQLTELMEGATRSYRQGCQIEFPLD